MSERPLFQNMDEQEAAYAPQQRPEGDAMDQVAADEGTSDRGTGERAAALPVAATGGAVNEAGQGYAGGTAGTTSGMVPAIGAVALGNHLEKQDEAERRD